MEPTPLLAQVMGTICGFPPGVDKPIWVPERCVLLVTRDEDHDTPSALGDGSSNNNLIMGDGESGEKSPTFNAS